jgi:predicted porin
VRCAAVLATALATATPAAGQQADVDRLMAMIEAQQRQIDALRAEVAAIRSSAAAPAHAATVATPPATTAALAPMPAVPADVDGDADTEAQMVTEGFVFRDAAGRSLTVSGQVNPAVNVVDDGLSTDVLIVDNDTSNSRLRFDVDAPLDAATFGGTLEFALSPNNSYAVSQLEPNADAEFDTRKAEVTIRDDRFGRLQLGHGSSAADDTAEYDLTLVAGSIMYSGVADIAGGVLFTDGHDYLDVTVGDAFFNFDPGNETRIRYDSPMFGPLQGSVSWAAEDQWAAALTLGGDYGDWTGWTLGDVTLLAAVAAHDPGEDGVDYAYTASASALHDPTGLSLTLSAGGQKLDGGGDDPSNLYGKLGWDTELFALGPTGFGVDYTYGRNVSGDGDRGRSWGLAAVQRIDRYGIDLYTQFRVYDLDSAETRGVRDVVVGTFGTKFTF